MKMIMRRPITWKNDEKMSYQLGVSMINGVFVPPLKYSINTFDLDRYIGYDYSFCFSSDISLSCFDGSRG